MRRENGTAEDALPEEREGIRPVDAPERVWGEPFLFPAEQAWIVKLLVERVDVQVDGLEVRLRAERLASIAAELRQPVATAKAA